MPLAGKYRRNRARQPTPERPHSRESTRRREHLRESPRFFRKDGQEAYPNLPDSDRAGFIFAIPKLPPGPHWLTVVIVAKDGGQTTLRRQFQTK